LSTYCDGILSNKNEPTIGVDFKVKRLLVGDSLVNLQIWDTGGREMFRQILKHYVRGSNAFLIVYDVTNQQSFEDVAVWMNMISEGARDEAANSSRTILVGNKCDAAFHERVSKRFFSLVLFCK
jgi:small GTP-binding protein